MNEDDGNWLYLTNTVYKQQVAANVADLELEPEDARRVYRFMVGNWLNPGDAEIVAGNMGLIYGMTKLNVKRWTLFDRRGRAVLSFSDNDFKRVLNIAWGKHPAGEYYFRDNHAVIEKLAEKAKNN